MRDSNPQSKTCSNTNLASHSEYTRYSKEKGDSDDLMLLIVLTDFKSSR